MTDLDPTPTALDLDAIAVLAAQHQMELNPTGTAHWLRHRVTELRAELERERRAHVCTERCAPNAHVAFQGRQRVTELEAQLAAQQQVIAAARRVLAAGHLDWDGRTDVEGAQGDAHAALAQAVKAVDGDTEVAGR